MLALQCKIDTGEKTVGVMERHHMETWAQLLELRLRLEGQEDWERKNAMRIKGMPGGGRSEPLL